MDGENAEFFRLVERGLLNADRPILLLGPTNSKPLASSAAAPTRPDPSRHDGSEMSQPLFTIITVSMNSADTIRDTLESVLDQEFDDYEYLVVDGDSADQTVEILRQHGPRFEGRMKWISEPDRGAYHAMNKGIALASGEWIHILNSDDRYADASVLYHVARITRPGYDLIATAIRIETPEIGAGHTWVPRYISEQRHYNFPHPGTFIRRAFYDRVGLYNERFRIISDALFGIQHYPKARYHLSDEVTVVMRAGGMSDRQSWSNIIESFLGDVFFHRFTLRVKVRRTARFIRESFRRLLESPH